MTKPRNIKRGRPAWVPQDMDIKQVEQLAGLGLTTKQIAEAIGIHYATLAEKRHEFPELDEAIKRGKAKGIAHVAGKLMAKITAMDTASIIFYLKTQAAWREGLIITGEDGSPLIPALTVSFVDSETTDESTDESSTDGDGTQD